MAIGLLAYVATFSGKPYFWENYTSSHFFRVTTSTQKLLFRSRYFFRTATFYEELSFFTTSQQSFFQNSYFFRKLLSSSQFLRIVLQGRYFLEHRPFSCRHCLGIFRRGPSSNQVLLHSINFFRRVTFSKKLIFWKSNMPYGLHFYFFRVVTF